MRKVFHSRHSYSLTKWTSKLIIRGQEDVILFKGKTYKEDISILNKYAPNIVVSDLQKTYSNIPNHKLSTIQ